MRSWKRPTIPDLQSRGDAPRVFDEKTRQLQRVPAHGTDASMYTCGITPYDATHMGHAATYVAFDTLTRVWLDAGLNVRTAMNSTDVDDPLLERAVRDGIDWRELAEREQQLFRDDMEALRILPPDQWVAVTDTIDETASEIARLIADDAAYVLDGDVYFDATIDRGFPLGSSSHTDREEMLALFRERGGDPDRKGKRDPLDALLWRAERPGEPAWDSPVGRGRPGWHIECTVIARATLGTPFTVAAGGSDLRFPHQEMQAQHALALGSSLFSAVRCNAGMVSYQGEKMSKSLGNLVKVSELRAAGVRPAAIRLALLAHHWRSDWEWTAADLTDAHERLDRWLAWASELPADPSHVDSVVDWLRVTLQEDLDTPAALQAVDRFIERAPADEDSVAAIDALLGIQLR